MKKIEMTVSETGEIQIKTSGYSGKACKVATEKLEKALGQVTDDKATSEMYDKEATANVESRR